MPIKPRKPCNKPGCPALTDGRYCDAHAVEAETNRKLGSRERFKRLDAKRPGPRQRGYSPAWDKVSKMFRRNNPLCVHCLKDGRTTASREVDHIVPKSLGGTDDPDNLQALCHECHTRKTMMEKNDKRKDKLFINSE